MTRFRAIASACAAVACIGAAIVTACTIECFAAPTALGPDRLATARDVTKAAPSPSTAWRMSGRLESASGGAYDFSVAFFHYAGQHGFVLDPASFSLVDERAHTYLARRRSERELPGLAQSQTAKLGIRVGDWSISESPPQSGKHVFNLHIRVDGAILNVRGVAKKPGIIFDEDVSPQLEYTSVATSGTLTLANEKLDVSGKAWLDRESAFNPVAETSGPVGRFHVQLDDGREILIETTGTSDGWRGFPTSVLIQRDGSTEHLAFPTYQFTEDGGVTWLSTHTNARYPDLWFLHVDGQTQQLLLQPVIIDQESVSHGTGQSYWDGAVDVYDVTPGSEGRRLGSGYVLLTGYEKRGIHS